MKKLKPVIFIEGEKHFYRENRFAQNLLIKAISEGVTNPKELKKIAGLKTVSDVYRTLDKMALRKEYHNALIRSGIDFDYIVSGIKNVCDGDASHAIKLKGFQTLLRSLGLERYEKDEDTGKSWEEAVIKALEEEKDESREVIEVKEYSVESPSTPITEKEREEKEKAVGVELYGD